MIHDTKSAQISQKQDRHKRYVIMYTMVWYNKILSIKFYLSFSELFILRKYVKIRFKNSGSPWYFLSSRGQKIRNITNIEPKRLFLLTFLLSFSMGFQLQKMIYTINVWFNFVFALFLEQGNLLNLIIFGVHAKRWPKYEEFQNRNWFGLKSDRWFCL